MPHLSIIVVIRVPCLVKEGVKVVVELVAVDVNMHVGAIAVADARALVEVCVHLVRINNKCLFKLKKR